MTNKVYRIAIALVTTLLVVGAASGESNLWFHVRVDAADGAKVTVNLPLTMIEKAVAMVPEEHLDHQGLHFDDYEMTPAEMRELWQELKNSPDMTFVEAQKQGEDVKIWKESGYLYVTALEGEDNEKVDVRVPFAVVDALLSGDQDELDIEAAMQALVAEGEGELVTVTSDSDNVRIWIDAVAEAK